MVRILSLLAFATLASVASAQQILYHWSSNNGNISESGGNIVQHNATTVSRINNECSGYYVITLLGRGENIINNDHSEKGQYMEITLDAGNTFRAGDIITVSGMRNTTDTKAYATLFMQFDNGIIIKDGNTWNNLGQLYETTVESGITTDAKRMGPGNEDLEIISAFPSTYSFVVNENAKGCTSLRLARDIYQCRLYITEIDITRSQATKLESIASDTNATVFDVSGRRTSNNQHGIVISHGKKILR